MDGWSFMTGLLSGCMAMTFAFLLGAYRAQKRGLYAMSTAQEGRGVAGKPTDVRGASDRLRGRALPWQASKPTAEGEPSAVRYEDRPVMGFMHHRRGRPHRR